MKKVAFLLLVLCLCLLPACSSQKKVSGKIVETRIDKETSRASFVIQADTNQEIGIWITEETLLFSFVEDITADDLKTGSLTDVIVSVTYQKFPRSFMTQDRQQIAAYRASEIQIVGFLTSETAMLSDGTNVEIWQYSNETVYILPNGAELLRITDPIGPQNVYVGGIESLDDLEEQAQHKVLTFYQEQGLRYDANAALEKAYSDYIQKGRPAKFHSHRIKQAISPTASNAHMMYFLTSTLLPIDDNYYYESRIGAAFNRKTGAVISNWDLFSCSPEEAKQALLDIAGITDPVLRQEMIDAFKPENIILFPGNLEVCFQQGTLPSEAYSYLLGLNYDDRLSAILHEWAVPQSSS